MAHGYSLRPNSKGRRTRRHQSADETKEQVESTSTSTSTSTDELEGESGVVDPRPATPDTPRARVPHSPPWHSHIIVTSSAPTTSRYHIDGPPEAIQAARKRQEARSTADAVRIRREQIVRGYEEDLRSLRARIVVLRRECEVKVEMVRRKLERKWAFERGEVAVVVGDDEDGDKGRLVGSDLDLEDTDGGEMAVDKHFVQTTETTSLTTNNDDDKQQWQWSSRSSQSVVKCWSHRSESNFPPPRPRPLQETQQQHHLSQRQQQEDDERGPAGEIHTVPHTGRRLLQKNHPSQGHGRTSSHSRPRPHRPQPLLRQPTQLMMIPTSSHGTDGDKEMDG